ncbi:MAG: hypothetical protein RI922_1787 [Bacteroidota bacterium]|jgi:hypothetical protein
MKLISVIFFSIIGISASAQKNNNNEDSIYFKGLNWFTTQNEYKDNQKMFQNLQPLYHCIFNADSLMTDCFVYFENGEIAVHMKAINTQKVYPGNDSIFYFLNVSDQNTTFYHKGKIRSVAINTGYIATTIAYNKKGNILFSELTIDQKHIDGLILTDMNNTEMILNYYQKGDLIAIVKTDYYFNSSSIEFCRKPHFLYRKKIKKILKFKFLGE